MKTEWMAAGIALLCVVGLAVSSFAGPAQDNDGDGVFDVLDNCSTMANGPPNDCDTDDDGYGNYCDGDFDNNGSTNSNDFTVFFVPAFQGGVPTATGTDMDCNGAVNSNDFTGKFVGQFGKGAPGPSGLHCAGSVPCDL